MAKRDGPPGPRVALLAARQQVPITGANKRAMSRPIGSQTRRRSLESLAGLTAPLEPQQDGASTQRRRATGSTTVLVDGLVGWPGATKTSCNCSSNPHVVIKSEMLDRVYI